MKIKYTGNDVVFSQEVGYEVGNSLISPGETLDLPDKLANGLLESNQNFKPVESKTKTEETK